MLGSMSLNPGWSNMSVYSGGMAPPLLMSFMAGMELPLRGELNE